MDDKRAALNLHSIIYRQITKLNYHPEKELVIFCIGTDRSTGDSLGPLTGTLLHKLRPFPATIIGNIDSPVHASNLEEFINLIKNKHHNPFVIAIDAGLGKESSVGYINVTKGPLQPGTGVNKQLPEIGDMHITGLVNVGGYMEYLVLQSTRLSVVMKMANIIKEGLYLSILALKNEKTAID